MPPKEKVAKTNKASEGGKTIKIGRDLRIASAVSAYGALRAASDGAEDRVMLDARQVEKVDAAGIQALLAGRRELLRAGKAVSWSGCSAQLKSAAGLLGLAKALELPE
jgi:anti-anti-sigma regulatory factor